MNDELSSKRRVKRRHEMTTFQRRRAEGWSNEEVSKDFAEPYTKVCPKCNRAYKSNQEHVCRRG